MNHFCLLQAPDTYTPHDWDLIADTALREYWLDRFADHFEELSAHALSRYGRGATRQIDAVRKEFLATIDRLRTDPASAPGGVTSQGAYMKPCPEQVTAIITIKLTASATVVV